MFAALGRGVVRFRKAILVVTLLLAVGLGAAGAGVFDKLSSGGFENASMESSRASSFLEEHYGVSDANLVLLVSSDAGVDDPAVAAAGLATTRRLAGDPDVTEVVSYWSAGSAPPLASHDRKKAVVVARILGTEDDVDAAIERISAEYNDAAADPSVAVGGFAETYREAGEQTERDLRTAELVTLPIILVLLLLVFGSVVSASLPLLVGGFAIIGTFFVLSVIASLTQVSVFSVNLTTAMGLGLGVDYSLFIVSRFREELHAGASPHDAAVTTVDTAGRTVAFSALTVAIALAALLVFPLPFLRSFAYAGIPVVILAAAAAMISLTAGLAVLGRRVDALTLWRRSPGAAKAGVWHRIATFVMRRPWPVAVGVTLLLLVLAAPFLRITLGLPDDRVLPDDASSHQVAETIRTEFDSDEAGRFMLVVPEHDADSAGIAEWSEALSRTEGISRVEGPAGVYATGNLIAPPGPESARFASGGSVWVAAIPSVDPYGEAAQDALAALRASDAPGDLLVGGQTAQFVDARDVLFSRLPLALTLIAIATFVLLFLMTGSILVPVKAIFLNILSLTATFGAMVWIFQDGNLSGVLDFTATGWIDLTTPILMFCIAFGLSMDYEVFLLSRIKEEYDRTGDNESAIALGLERTGRIVTAAAVLLAVVFVGFGTSHVMFVKLFGLGLALAVLVDAFLVRATLVPAFMRLAGNANWWAPRPLRRLHARIGFSETGTAGPVRKDTHAEGSAPSDVEIDVADSVGRVAEREVVDA